VDEHVGEDARAPEDGGGGGEEALGGAYDDDEKDEEQHGDIARFGCKAQEDFSREDDKGVEQGDAKVHETKEDDEGDAVIALEASSEQRADCSAAWRSVGGECNIQPDSVSGCKDRPPRSAVNCVVTGPRQASLCFVSFSSLCNLPHLVVFGLGPPARSPPLRTVPTNGDVRTLHLVALVFGYTRSSPRL
jgi:hypothetical protein